MPDLPLTHRTLAALSVQITQGLLIRDGFRDVAGSIHGVAGSIHGVARSIDSFTATFWVLVIVWPIVWLAATWCAH